MTKLSITRPRLTGALTLSTLTLTATLVAGACSLDLDEALIDANADGGVDASAGGGTTTGGSAGVGGSSLGGSGGTGATTTGGTGGTAQGGSGGVAAGGTGAGGSAGIGGTAGTGGQGTCQSASDCPTSNACLQPYCQSGRCIYESCPPAGVANCEARSCSAQNDSCQSSGAFGFNAHQFQIQDSIGCSGNAEKCLAAMGSLLFVGTTGSGILVYDMSDPTAPRAISLQQPPFAITRLIEAEGRILIQGPISAGKLSLAWVDEPSSPLVDNLSSTAVAVNFDDTLSTGYPADPGAFHLVRNSAAAFYPARRVAPPITNGTPFSLFSSAGIPQNAAVVASSGTRLITFRVDTSVTQNEPLFSLETNAGTAMAQNGGELSLIGETGEVPSSTSAHRFDSTRSGALLWTTNQLVRPDGGPLETTAVVLRWPLLDGDDATFLGTRVTTLESYSSMNSNSALSGPAAQIGSDHALATAAASGNTAQTAVHGTRLTGDALAPSAGTSRFVIPFSTGQIGVAGGVRYGYVMGPTSTTDPLMTTIYVFAPGC